MAITLQPLQAGSEEEGRSRGPRDPFGQTADVHVVFLGSRNPDHIRDYFDIFDSILWIMMYNGNIFHFTNLVSISIFV